MSALARAIDAMRGMTRGMIVVGVIPTMSEVMAAVARLGMETLPGLKLKLKIAFSTELTTALLDGELDCCSPIRAPRSA